MGFCSGEKICHNGLMAARFVFKEDKVRIRVFMPRGSEAQVKAGDRVGKEAVLAYEPWTVAKYDLSKRLGVGLKKVEGLLKRKIGEMVSKGEVLAECKRWWGRRKVISHVNGKVIGIDKGVVCLQLDMPRRKILSPISAKVTGWGDDFIELEARAKAVKGWGGWGEIVWGKLEVVGSRVDGARLEMIEGDFEGKVMVTGGKLAKACWYKLCALGIRAVVCNQVAGDWKEWESIWKEDDKRSVVVLGNESGFEEFLWKWFNKGAQKIAVVDGEGGRVFLCDD